MTALLVPPTAPAEDAPRPVTARAGGADRVFRGIARSSGVTVLLIMSLVGLFLAIRGADALAEAGPSFLTTAGWDPDAGEFGIAAVLTGSVLIALVAIFFALPLALGTALYLSDYAPVRARRALVSVVDLMAAVPSVVYGLWGLFFLQGQVIGLSRWLSDWFGFLPWLAVDRTNPDSPLPDAALYSSSTFIAGLVVALMVTPIACSVMREVFSQAPVGEREAALALGATRWGMVRTVVLPFGKGGIIGGTMLGLGRALGETIAVFLILSVVFVVQPQVLQTGGSSVSSLIALRYGEASDFATSALMAAGLALFLLTLVVNFAASSVVARSRSGAETGA